MRRMMSFCTVVIIATTAQQSIHVSKAVALSLSNCTEGTPINKLRREVNKPNLLRLQKRRFAVKLWSSLHPLPLVYPHNIIVVNGSDLNFVTLGMPLLSRFCCVWQCTSWLSALFCCVWHYGSSAASHVSHIGNTDQSFSINNGYRVHIHSSVVCYRSAVIFTYYCFVFIFTSLFLVNGTV